MGLAERLTRHRFLLLLISLTLLLTSYPLEEGHRDARVVFNVVFELVLLAGLVAMRRERLWLLAGVALILPGVLIFWSSILGSGSMMASSALIESIEHLSMGLYLALLITFILRDLFSSAAVTADRLCGAMSVYLMLGVAWGFFYSALELYFPGSFTLAAPLDPGQPLAEIDPLQRSGVLFYYSFVTLTTLGYGDVSPVSPTAQMLAMWEAIVGQIYLTILVARLVGLHVSSAVPQAADPPAGD